MVRQILCEICDKNCHNGLTTSDHKRESRIVPVSNNLDAKALQEIVSNSRNHPQIVKYLRYILE